MNSRTLLTMLIAVGVLTSLAIAVSLSQRPDRSDNELLLPQLAAMLNDIDRITVQGGGAKTIATLVRGERGWGLAERDGFPADIGRIRKNLIALAEARIIEEKTSNPDLYDRLGVEDIDKDTASGTLLELAKGAETLRVIVGRTGVGGGDRAYARRAGEPTSWLVSAALDLPRDGAQWLDRSLTDIAAARVHAVSIRHPGGETLRVEKPAADAADFAVRDLPEGRELTYPAVANGIGGALADLAFENVERGADFSPGSIQPIIARFETVDGLIVEISTWRLPAGERVRISASADAALAGRLAPAASAAAGDKAEAKAATAAAPGRSFAEVQAEAARITARHENWVYTLPEFKGEQLTRKLGDLLQPQPPSN